MTSSLFPTSLSKPTSFISHKILISHTNFAPKFEVGTSYFGQKPCRAKEFAARRRRNFKVEAAALGGLLGGLFKGSDTGESTRQKYADSVALINRLEPAMERLSDSELRERTTELKEKAQNGESLDSLLPEAFAVVREGSRRVLGLRPFDVQLIGGMVLHKGETNESCKGMKSINENLSF